MEWSPQQVAALQAAEEWLRAVKRGEADQVFRLFGFAGTGKSTLAQHIGQLETDAGGYVQYAAFTGKAAVVLRRKGCSNARTLHSLIYTTMEKGKGQLDLLEAQRATAVKQHGEDSGEVAALDTAIMDEKDRLQQPGFALKDDALTLRYDTGEPTGERISLFIIDEVSMVDHTLASDLMSFGAPVLVLGDPAQLPPVHGTGFFTQAAPNVLLTEIHRQAADNPIIELATQVRNGYPLKPGQYGESIVCGKRDLPQEEWLGADQILVGRNATKDMFNQRIRTLRGYEGFLPCVGEKLVCLRNNRDDGLLNGSLWEVLATVDDPKGDTFALRLQSLDDGDARRVECLAHKSKFLGLKLDDWSDRLRANEFDFGYALTVHKSQGSQWDTVLLYDEAIGDREKWRYTGITRAAKRIIVVKP